MGQMTVGIMLGVESPENIRDADWSKPYNQHTKLLDRWERECAVRIDALRTKLRAKVAEGRMHSWDAHAEERYIPDVTHDGERDLLGFWIAVGASGKGGIPTLGTVALGAVRTTEPYAKAYQRARRRWWRFARWARTQGVTLPKPRLWIAETEVA